MWRAVAVHVSARVGRRVRPAMWGLLGAKAGPPGQRPKTDHVATGPNHPKLRSSHQSSRALPFSLSNPAPLHTRTAMSIPVTNDADMAELLVRPCLPPHPRATRRPTLARGMLTRAASDPDSCRALIERRKMMAGEAYSQFSSLATMRCRHVVDSARGVRDGGRAGRGAARPASGG